MSQATGIEWTDSTWNPVRGCSRVSEGCRNCYAERVAARFSNDRKPGEREGEYFKGPFDGFAEMKDGHPRWTGKVALVEKHLLDPLRWREPRRIFVNSMSDLFHESLPDEAIDRVFAVMALAPRHTFQILTKRPERMRAWFAAAPKESSPSGTREEAVRIRLTSEHAPRGKWCKAIQWPLPNVWLGVSTEDQRTADERIPLLLQTPAAVRFVSAEPLLGEIDFDMPRCDSHGRDEVATDKETGEEFCNECAASGWGGELSHGHWLDDLNGGLNWVIVGGESGHEARPCDIAWIRSIKDQCKAAGVPVFVKQGGKWLLGDDTGFRVNHWLLRGGRGFVPPIVGPLAGKRPTDAVGFSLFDSKGGNLLEWPEDLRVREFPK